MAAADAEIEEFQSTLSLRRATRVLFAMFIFAEFQSTLSLRRATSVLIVRLRFMQFQSTLSLRRATVPVRTNSMPRWNFNPRSPCGERLLRRRL